MQLRRFFVSILLSTLACGAAAASESQHAIRPIEEYAKRVQAAQTIAPLTSDLFGERISLYNGATEFAVVDIDLPGDGPAVQLGRRFKIESRRSGHALSGFGAWDIDVPYMTATFGPDGWNGGTPDRPRCTETSAPQIYSQFDLHDYWSGIRMHLPGDGDFTVTPMRDGALRPTDGGTWRWYTREHHRLSCLPATRNGYPGQGFVAVDQDGTRYTFDVGLERYSAAVSKTVLMSAQLWEVKLARVQVYLLASRVEDRHGNWTQYHYQHLAGGTRLGGITSSDGRSISLSHDSHGNIIRAEANGRAWTYEYDAVRFGWDASYALKRVVLPDATAWSYDYRESVGTALLWPVYPNDDGSPGDFRCLPPPQAGEDFFLTATHPGGTTGTFEFHYVRHERSGTYDNCTADFKYLDHTYYSLKTPEFFDGFAITRKTLTGPGLSPAIWQYGNNAPVGITGRSRQVPCTTCAQTRTTVVTNPDGTRVRYTFGALFRVNDGLLLGEEVLDAAGNVLRATTHRHLTAEESVTRFPTLAAFMHPGDDGVAAEYRPVVETTISQDGATFTRSVSDFDALGRAVRLRRHSSLGFTRTERTDFHDDWALWTVGQVRRLVLEAPIVQTLAETEFDARALPITEFAFGALRHRATYHLGGQLATLKDGKGNTTRFNQWKRGIPQSITYADGTAMSAVVDDAGLIASVTDQANATSRYTYDAMGRMVKLDHPDNDTTPWHDTTLSFVRATAPAYGLPAGHWKQDVRTGGAVTSRYFDSMWRPVVEVTYDAADPLNTATHLVKRFDFEGRTAFASHPTRSFGNATTVANGTRTTFDALGRVLRQEQDTELGVVAARHEYLPGFVHKATDARGNTTTTRFMAFDAPATDAPIEIVEPEDVHTRIVRDIHGKPTELRRDNSAGTTSLSRVYVYDAHARLCKTVEPETGATVVDYDSAGNVAWTASGLPLSNPNACNRSEAIASGQRVLRSYDSMNRLSILDFPDGNGSQQWTYHGNGAVAGITTINDGLSIANAYAFNLRGLLTRETQSVGGDAAWTLTYGWNSIGNLASLTYPSGTVVDFAPNALGQATRAGAFATAAAYHPNGTLAGFRYGNGLTRSITQNARGLPDRIRDSTGAGAARFDESHDYDGNGNVVAVSDGMPGARRDRTMAYDGRNRLTAAVSPMFGDMQYRYDVLDNLVGVRAPGRNWDYVHDATNRLTNIVDATTNASVMGFGYDARGNLSNRSGRQHVFDYGNRLRRVAGLERYTYDGHGRRVGAANDDATGASVRSMYGHDGVLRHQRDGRQAEAVDYITLSGTLVAHSASTIAPAPPVITAPGYSTSGTFDIAWNATPKAARYELDERLDLGPWTLSYNGNALTTKRTGLGNGNWSYRVRACNTAGCGGWGPIVAVAVQRPPAMPASIQVPTQGPSGTYTVTWTQPQPRDTGATTYKLEERFNQGAWTTAYSGEALTKSFTARASGTYVYRLAACNPFGCSTTLAGANSVTVVHPPAAPSLTVPGPQLQAYYAVSWTNTAAVHYELDERFNGGAWTRIHSAAQTSRSITGRVTGTYGYRVRGCNSAGCGAYSAARDVQVTTPPASAPVVTLPASNYGGTYSVAWASVATATRYEVTERVDSAANTVVYNGAAVSLARSGKSTGRWEYSVRACNAAGCGSWSAAKAIDVLIAPSQAPTILDSTKLQTAGGSLVQIECSVRWSAVPRATRYELKVPDSGLVQYHGAATSVSAPNANYCAPSHVIRACNAAGCSAWSNPPKPQRLELIPVGEDGVPI